MRLEKKSKRTIRTKEDIPGSRGRLKVSGGSKVGKKGQCRSNRTIWGEGELAHG